MEGERLTTLHFISIFSGESKALFIQLIPIPASKFQVYVKIR